MADPAVATPQAAKQPYQDTSVQDWMGGLKTELDIPTAKPPPLFDANQPEPTAPDDPSSTVPSSKPAGTPTNTPATPAPAKEPAAKEVPVGDKTPASPEPEKKWPRTAVEWDNYKKADKERLEVIAKEKDEIKAERDKIKAEIETLRKQGPSPELDSLKKERDELSDRLRLVSVEQHPKFKSYFENKTNAQLDMAKRIAGPDKGERIVALLKAPEGPLRDQELEQALADLNTVQQSRIASVLNNLADIDAERQGEISKARESYQKIQTDQTEAQKQAQVKSEQSFNDLIVSVSDKDKGNLLFQKKDGDEAWNTGVEQRVNIAKELLFGNVGQDNLMKAALAAASVPAILEHAKNITAENDRLKAQIKELSAAQPTVATVAPTPTGIPKLTASGVRANDPTADPMQAAANWMKAIHAPE